MHTYVATYFSVININVFVCRFLMCLYIYIFKVFNLWGSYTDQSSDGKQRCVVLCSAVWRRKHQSRTFHRERSTERYKIKGVIIETCVGYRFRSHTDVGSDFTSVASSRRVDHESVSRNSQCAKIIVVFIILPQEKPRNYYQNGRYKSDSNIK